MRGKRCWTWRNAVEGTRDHYGKGLTGRQIAERLGKPLHRIHNMADKLGLRFQTRIEWDAKLERLLRDWNRHGRSDSEFAALIGGDRHSVSRKRQRLGLPFVGHSEFHRERIRQNTNEMLRRKGLNSIGDLRAESFRQFAREQGWPEDLRPRAVQILNVLAASGAPMTRRQICEATGMPWKGSRKSLVSNDPEGSYLAHLAGRGLVTRLVRAAPQDGTNYRVDLYTLGPEALTLLEKRCQQQTEQ